MRAAPQNGVRVSPTHPLLSRAWPRNVWHPSAHWETSRIAAIGPRAARYGRSRPLLTLAPFTALRTRARVKKEYLPTHPWASGKTPARALRKWRATGVNQFGHTANAVWRPSGESEYPTEVHQTVHLKEFTDFPKKDEKDPTTVFTDIHFEKKSIAHEAYHLSHGYCQ